MSRFSSVQSFSHVQFFATSRTEAQQASLSITNSWSLLKLMPIESVRPSNHLILCHPLLPLPSVIVNMIFCLHMVFLLSLYNYPFLHPQNLVDFSIKVNDGRYNTLKVLGRQNVQLSNNSIKVYGVLTC